MPYADNQGVWIHYQLEGEGPPLVLQHGFSGSLENWQDFGYTDRLKQDYQLILVDARGHGASDKPHEPEAYELKLRAGDVVAVLDSLNLSKAHYFGYSMGGWIGFGLAKYAPTRFNSLIIGGAEPYAQTFEDMLPLLNQGMEAWIAPLEEFWTVSPKHKARLLKNDVQALLAERIRGRPDISEVLPTMTMPCLLFAGEADELCSVMEREASKMSNAAFFSLPDLNHLDVYLRGGDLVVPHIIEFLGKVALD